MWYRDPPALPSFAVEHEWSSALPLKQVTAGSLPVNGTMVHEGQEKDALAEARLSIGRSVDENDKD